MPRSAKPLPVDLGRVEADLDRDLQTLAEERHPANFLLTEYDWLRAQEMAIAQGEQSVSDVIRKALVRYLDTEPEAERVRNEALHRLGFELDRRRRQDQYPTMTTSSGNGASDGRQTHGRRGQPAANGKKIDTR